MRRWRGFTLVELLVVIAIISLLVALLVPALGQIMQQVQSSQCKANLSCQGMALQLYVNEHDSYPGHADNDGASGGVVAVWPSRIRKYAESMDIFRCPANEWSSKWQKKVGTPDGIVYATQDQADKWGYELGEKMLDVATVPFTYGYNDRGRWKASATQRGLGGDMSTLSPVRASEVLKPRKMIAIGDSTSDTVADFNIYPFSDAASEYPGKIHFDGANILYCGGEVKWDLQADLTDVVDAGGSGTSAQQDMTKLWNNHNQVGQ